MSKKRFTWMIFIVLLILASVRWVGGFFYSPYPKSGLEVHCIDVGQGDSTAVIGPTQVMLIDAGEPEYGDEVVRYLKELGVRRIDYAVVTHPHSDHMGGMTNVLEQLSVRCLVVNGEVSEDSVYEEMIQAAEKRKVPVKAVACHDKLPYADAECTVLGPVSLTDENENNRSIALHLRCGDMGFLFTGDAEEEEERDLLRTGEDLSADLLQVGHHGSKYSSTPSFLKRVQPQCAVISCGIGNSYGHPNEEALQRLEKAGAQIYRTDLDGTVVIVTDGKQLYLKKNKK